MKKIDLHIHTVPTISDSFFEFSLDKLEEYIKILHIDCIAITNHNLFDIEQFKNISTQLNIAVLPGIEIDLEGGHILLISENNELLDFDARCKQIQNLNQAVGDSISVDNLKRIFPDLSNYLLIPHYDKKPNIKDETISKLSPHIFVGEVTSIRKFKACMKDANKLLPVIFSDVRIKKDLKVFPTRQTFIDLDIISLRGIKSCFFDKAKVSLSSEDGNDFFQVLDSGLFLSTGLNIILGERSSGKTHTLDKICNTFDNVKYIKQFSLLQNDEEKFKNLLSVRHSSVTDNFFKEFKEVVTDVKKVDLKSNKMDLEKYINSLVKFASESNHLDSFSKSSLFSETQFIETDLISLEKLIKATLLLIENTEYNDLIIKHISLTTLINLAFELIKKLKEITEENLKKRWLNGVVLEIQNKLRFKTSNTFPEDIDFYTIIIENEKVKKFNKVVKAIQIEREINRKEIRGFKVVANTKMYTGAQHLKNKSGRQIAFSQVFENYENPYKYLGCLKNINIEETEYYKYFVDIEYLTLNKNNFPVSGGERSEFNLLHEISDALKYDLLLIDEPESSFDNVFLKSEVNELIKDISKEIPVIVVTHNSTVGASIKPDYIAYTCKNIIDKKVIYQVYCGYPSCKHLKSLEGEFIENYQILLNCLEAGKTAYYERKRSSYEIFEN